MAGLHPKSKTWLKNRIAHLEAELTALKSELAGREFDHEEGVYTSDLKPYIKAWLDNYQAQHGTTGSKFLAELAVVSDTTIHQIMQGKTKITTLATADRLLTAMHMSYVLADMEIVQVNRKRTEAPAPPPSQYWEE